MQRPEIPPSLSKGQLRDIPETEPLFRYQKEYERAQEIFQSNKLEPKQFAGRRNAAGHVFAPLEVQADQLALQKKKKLIERTNLEKNIKAETKKYALILEAIIYELTEKAEWLGRNGCTVSASEFDDILNGVDEVFELKKSEAGEHLDLAIDVTFASSEKRGTIRDKIRREEHNIMAGHLAEVKYFQSEWEEEPTSLKNIPRVVIGCDKIAMEGLIRLWSNLNRVQQANNAGPGDRARFWEQAKNHPLQFQILRQIEMQLEYFENFAEAHGKMELARIIQKRLEIIKYLLSTKRIVNEGKAQPEESLFEKDRVFIEIKKALRGNVN